VDALKRECRQLDRMNHANIVRFRELVVNEGGVAMVLELLRGQDLHDRLAAGPLPVDTAVPVVEAILDGLGHAHAAGVLHRDIKPGNVYWCDDGRIVILDFGIARAADGTQATKTGQMVGTFDYMAPERMSGSGGTASSDVYAVGLIAWELLAGRPASPEGEVARKLMWHMMEGVGDAAKVAAMLPGCPSWFAELIATLAAKDPTARPVDGSAALALLREKRAGAGAPSAAPAGRRPPPSTVMGPAPVGSVPPVASSVPPVSVPPTSTGRSAPPGTVMGPAPVPPPSAPPPTTGRSAPPGTVMGPAPSAPPASAPPGAAVPTVPPAPAPAAAAVPPPASGSSVSKVPLLVAGALVLAGLVAGALVLAGGAWWLGRSVGPTTTSFGYTLGPVPAGTYTIGSPPTEADRSEDEAQHSVTLTRGFLMGTTEVTQGQYKALMGTNPVVSQTNCDKVGNTAVPADQEPVYCVSWVDAALLANAASVKEGLESCYQVAGKTVTWPKGTACAGYRLPTESEWEVAARGGGSGIYAGGNDLGGLGWFSDNSGGRTHPVGQKSPNGYGLYDMSGNVWEWTWDTYGDYPTSVTDPTGATEGPFRVTRGGSWFYTAGSARAADRIRNSPGNRYDYLGLRLSRTIP
jgi:formylglycine-generating enzyme required for sulfatase activity